MCDLISILNNVDLDKIIDNFVNNFIKERITTQNYFYTQDIPNMDIKKYITTVSIYFKSNTINIICALIYVLKFHRYDLNLLNIYKLYLTSHIIAIKYNDDNVYSNETFAKIANIKIKELNLLETKFCELCKWNFHITENEFKYYFDILNDDKQVTKL